MSELVIYHNPRCRKSRETLKLLEDRGESPKVIKYLDEAPSQAEIKRLLKKLGISAGELLRPKEKVAKELGIKKDSKADAIIKAMAQNPILIERPIVVRGEQARLGRPPELVLELFD